MPKPESPGQLIRRLLNLQQRQPEPRWLTISFDDPDGLVYVHIPAGVLSSLEEGKVIQLGGKYSGRLDQPHVPTDQEHFHLYAKGKNNPLMAINADGTLHHAGTTSRIPNRAADGIRRELPYFILPPDNIVDVMEIEEQHILLG